MIKDLETGAVQLFDLEDDLEEADDLSQKMPEKTEKLETLMDQRLEKLGAQIPEENPGYDPNATARRGRRRS